MKKIQDMIYKTFEKYFGTTPLKQRLKDIQNETWELINAQTLPSMREEMGDLLCSLLAGIGECQWNAEDLVNECLKKINRRKIQYSSIGRKINVALLGGSFDPIHRGHLEIAQCVLNYSSVIDEIWLTPCFRSMDGKIMANSQHRLNMCKKISEIDGRIKVFDYELVHKLRGETYHFIKKLTAEKELNDKYRFYFIIGADCALSLPRWPNSEYLISVIPFIVISRGGVDIPLNKAWFLNKKNIYLDPDNRKYSDVSSTYVRDLIKVSVDCQFKGLLLDELNKYVLPETAKYIIDNNLYKGNTDV